MRASPARRVGLFCRSVAVFCVCLPPCLVHAICVLACSQCRVPHLASSVCFRGTARARHPGPPPQAAAPAAPPRSRARWRAARPQLVRCAPRPARSTAVPVCSLLAFALAMSSLRCQLVVFVATGAVLSGRFCCTGRSLPLIVHVTCSWRGREHGHGGRSQAHSAGWPECLGSVCGVQLAGLLAGSSLDLATIMPWAFVRVARCHISAPFVWLVALAHSRSQCVRPSQTELALNRDAVVVLLRTICSTRCCRNPTATELRAPH